MNRLEKKLREYNPDLYGRYDTCKPKVELLLQKYATNFPKFTDHSISHTMAVLRIVSDLLSDHEIDKMNGKELYVLCMGTLLHDIGMCIPEEKIKEFELKKRYSDYKSKNPEKSQEELIRDLHHELSYDFIVAEYANLDIPNPFYAEAVALTAQAHRKVDLLDFEMYNPQFSVESGREHICLPYLGAILRLADELDIENSRTPDLLCKYYLPENEKSRLEWEKHRATFLVTMHGDTIKIQAKTNDQNIYHALEVQFSKVEFVLEECQKIIKRVAYTGEVGYTLQISKIKTDIKSEYIQKDIKFSINVPNVIETLMGKNLYKSEFDALRELIQNSLDSVLYKKSFGGSYIPSIIVDIYPDKIVCEDNGGGMDEYIIEKYFSKLSSSYYQSEKLNNNYNAIGKFGIGVFSYFMISEYIEVRTRKGSATPLHFLVDRNPENYFYFYQDPKQSSEGTIISLYFNQSFKLKQDVEIIKYIKDVFKYIKVPIILKMKDCEVEIFNNKTHAYCLNDFLDDYIDKHYWSIFSNQEIVEHKFENSNSEGVLMFLPEFTEKSILSNTFLDNELSETKTSPIKLYNQGIFVSEIEPILLQQVFGIVNITKSSVISLNRAEIKDYEIILIQEEICLVEKYLTKLKSEKKHKVANDFVIGLIGSGSLNNHFNEKSEEFKNLIFRFFRKYLTFQVFKDGKWVAEKISQIETQNLIYVFQTKEMCLSHLPQGANYSLVIKRNHIEQYLFHNHKIGINSNYGVYLETLFVNSNDGISEINEKSSSVNLQNDLCFVYTNLFKDKDGDLLYSNMIFNSEYPLFKFLESVILGEYSEHQKAFAKRQLIELKSSFNNFGGRIIRFDEKIDYYSMAIKSVSKVIDDINAFFKTKYILKKKHLPNEAKDIINNSIPLTKWIFR